jgi:predicted nucleic acid-binding protein
MAGLTLDTGALIALERRRQRIRQILSVAVRDGVRVTIPAPVVAEWWRRPSSFADDLLSAFDIEPLDVKLAKAAGEALASIAGSTTIDAIVMASAARRGDVVLTSDVDDLQALQRYFGSVRVLSV